MLIIGITKRVQAGKYEDKFVQKMEKSVYVQWYVILVGLPEYAFLLDFGLSYLILLQ